MPIIEQKGTCVAIPAQGELRVQIPAFNIATKRSCTVIVSREPKDWAPLE